MGRVKRPYGFWSRAMMEELRRQGLLKVDALLAWLAERDIQIDRTLVSHWAAGRSHLPADMLPCLAEFTGRPELVFGPFLREGGCELVRLPEERLGDRELVESMLGVGAAVGRLQLAVIEARAPHSPGGHAINDEERAGLSRRLDEVVQQLVDLKASLSVGAAPVETQ